MTTKPMSNHKPYLQLSRTETSLCLEGFVKHIRLMHFWLFLPRDSHAQPWCWCYSALTAHSISLLQSHEPSPSAAPRGTTFPFGASPCLSNNFPELNTWWATSSLIPSLPSCQWSIRRIYSPFFPGEVFISVLSLSWRQNPELFCSIQLQILSLKHWGLKA